MIHVWESDIEEGKVPSFFKEIWAQRHGSTIEENKALYEKLAKPQGRAYTIVLLAFVVTFVGIFLLALPTTGPEGKNPLLPYGWGWTIIPAVIAIAAWLVGRRLSPEKMGLEWHYRNFTDSVECLFRLFQIKPSRELGLMSREEFIKNIAGSLRTEAEHVEGKYGFARASTMDHWKVMHGCANWWKLCDEKYDKYFPTKEKPQATSSSFSL
jgi:hypothetical protein